ncbi:MAG: glycosyltransferase family 2 protein, partial [Chitinophagaceae bacterium]
MFSKLSILIPCYNEATFIAQTLEKILATNLDYNLDKEIIIVDDGSTDDSFRVIETFIKDHPAMVCILVSMDKNGGKGASIMNALRMASGDIVVIQDADLEYDPADYNKMLQPIVDGHADVVYGSRFMGVGPHR